MATTRESPADQRSEVVVGFDGSPSAADAVTWAAREAARRSADLRVVAADHYFGMASTGPGSPIVAHALAATSDEVAAEGIRLASQFLDKSRVTAATSSEVPAGALVRASESAALLVVGHRGRGTVTSTMLGSVSLTASAHAQCPVVVVRGHVDVEPGPDRPVVVGVDGSPASELAVSYAADAAARSGAPLEVLSAWYLPAPTGYEYADWSVHANPDWTVHLITSARQAAEAAADTASGTHPDLAVSTRVVQALPVAALELASTRAGLVVCGSRGLGGFKRLLLGGVSRGIIHHAARPVAVVRRLGAGEQQDT